MSALKALLRLQVDAAALVEIQPHSLRFCGTRPLPENDDSWNRTQGVSKSLVLTSITTPTSPLSLNRVNVLIGHTPSYLLALVSMVTDEYLFSTFLLQSSPVWTKFLIGSLRDAKGQYAS